MCEESAQPTVSQTFILKSCKGLRATVAEQGSQCRQGFLRQAYPTQVTQEGFCDFSAFLVRYGQAPLGSGGGDFNLLKYFLLVKWLVSVQLSSHWKPGQPLATTVCSRNFLPPPLPHLQFRGGCKEVMKDEGSEHRSWRVRVNDRFLTHLNCQHF